MHHPTLERNASFTTRVLESVRGGLVEQDFPQVRTIAVAGSFGRDEASEVSDADVIIVLQDGSHEDAERQAFEQRVVDATASEFERFGIARPNPKGVFANPRTMEELLPAADDGGFGTPDEPADLMGKRLLLLLESKPLWNEQAYDGVIDEIFGRYTDAHVGDDFAKEHVYMLNDLIRYFRYICVNYQSTFGNENEKWPLRNVKLRHSRLLMYSGLLALIGTASMHQDERKVGIVRDGLRLTPLERMRFAYDECQDFNFFRLAGLYDTFLARISDPDIRTVLNAIEYGERYQNTTFAALKANSDAFQAELARFIYERRGQWSDRFFEYLVL
jgi:predicted nucleotidyltransferase